MEKTYFVVARLDGDYAYLRNESDPLAEERCVARALLPAEIDEGVRLVYELFEYSLVQ